MSEHNVLAVQPWGLGHRDEELRSVRVGSSVGHRQQVRLFVLQREVFVLELFAVDRSTAGSVVVGEITALAHEAGNDAMEDGSFVMSGRQFTGAQRTEVFGRTRNDVFAQLITER